LPSSASSRAADSTSTLPERRWHDAHATDAAARSGGGQTRRRAIVLRFWTMAARRPCRVRRTGRAAAADRSRGESSGARSASRPASSRYATWRTPLSSSCGEPHIGNRVDGLPTKKGLNQVGAHLSEAKLQLVRIAAGRGVSTRRFSTSFPKRQQQPTLWITLARLVGLRAT
jgi:hypothetical protein